MKNIKENAVVNWIKDVAALIKANKKIALIVAAFIAVVAVGIIVAVSSGNNEEIEKVEVVTEEVQDDGYVVTDEALQQDAIPEIVDLMRKYYDSQANGDIDTLTSLRTGVDETERVVILEKSEYVEAYPTVTCYTKSGPVPDSYICFAFYEAKLYDFDTTVPGLNAWYVCVKDDGTYYINDDQQDEKLANYCKAISVQDDYVDLTNTVNVKFNEAVADDPQLVDFLQKLPDLMAAGVGEELAKANEPEEPEPTPEVVVSDTTEKKAKTTDVVNVRSSDSETADKLGKAQKGDQFTVLEQKINGWSKIEFEGKEGYIKSEYLEIIGEEANSSSSTDNSQPEVTDEEALANSPSSGKAKARDTVNIRKSASTDAEKLAVAYKGEEMTVVSKQDDGWSKVKFQGKTGYVKSEYLE